MPSVIFDAVIHSSEAADEDSVSVLTHVSVCTFISL